MLRDMVSIQPQASVKHAMRLMTHHRARHLPVMSYGALAGIVSICDGVKHRLEDLELEANVLRDAYSRSTELSHTRRHSHDVSGGMPVDHLFKPPEHTQRRPATICVAVSKV